MHCIFFYFAVFAACFSCKCRIPYHPDLQSDKCTKKMKEAEDSATKQNNEVIESDRVVEDIGS